MDDLARSILDFIKLHQGWGVALMFLAAFGESFVFIGLVLPGTAMLIAAGTLMQSGALPYLPVMGGAILGAVLGDAISYWLGRHFREDIHRLWPFRQNRELLAKGVKFFRHHGGKSVFIGRFFGPIRAVIPLAAGLMRMPRRWFWVANISSALVWAAGLLLFGDALARIGSRMIGSTQTVVVVFGGLVLFGLAALAWMGWRFARPKT